MKAIFGKLRVIGMPFFKVWTDDSIVIAHRIKASEEILSRLVGEKVDNQKDIVIFKVMEGTHEEMLEHMERWDALIQRARGPVWSQIGGQIHSVEVTKQSSPVTSHSFHQFLNRDGKRFIRPVERKTSNEFTVFFVEFKTPSSLNFKVGKKNF